MLASEILPHLKTALPEQRKPMLSDFIRELLVDFLELDALEDVATDQNFMDLSADSMQAVDFKFKLEQLLHCSLRSTLLFDYPCLDLLTDYLLHEVLPLPNSSLEITDNNPQRPIANPISQVEEIAIIAMAGIFPGAENVEALWEKVITGEPLSLAAQSAGQQLNFGHISNLNTAALDKLGITQDSFLAMDRQQQLMLKVLADAMANFGVTNSALSKQTTGVFIGAQQTTHDQNVPYQIPIANKLSFQLNLKGPSESVNTFCTSAYVALNRAMQSLHAGECQQAIVGGVNVIATDDFAAAANAGLYDNILSQDNQTKSFCDTASGYVRSEGAGIIILKPLSQAEQAGNNILAIVKSTAIYHGGRGYSYEAPNPQGLKATIKLSLEKAGINTDSIDYVEAHGIGNIMADALELGAINQSYRALSVNPDKHWHISCIKPSIGHPEMASGMASLLKVLKALEHKTLPGIANFGVINSELAADHALILQAENQPWPDTLSPKRVALNSYAIGGMNAHIILEEYIKAGAALVTDKLTVTTHNVVVKPPVHEVNTHDAVVAKLIKAIFNLELAAIEPSLSLVDYGFDSIKVMQFVSQLNETLNLNIKISQVLGVDNFAGFFALLAQEQHKKTHGGSKPEHQPEPLIAPPVIQSPLSEVQKGLWYVNQLAPNSIAFNVPLTFKMPGKVHPHQLQLALRAMLEAYPMLRANMVDPENTAEIKQLIRPVDAYVNLQEIHLLAEQELEATLLALLKHPFDLAKDPLVRLYVIITADNLAYVFFVIHHIVFDGTSGALFIPAFWEKYHALIAGKPLITQPADFAFLDYVSWERAYLHSTKASEDQAWWQAQLSTQAATINLPYDRLPQSTLSTSGIGCQKFTLDEASLSALKQLALKLKTNLSVIFLTAFQIFLHKLAQEQEIAVTIPVRGRPKQAHENSIGCYINVMVIPCSLVANNTFTDLVQQTRQQFFNCLDHANYPFPNVLADLGLTLTNPKENPFPVSYTYQNFFDELLNNAPVMQGVELLYDVYQQTEDNYTLEIYDFRKTLQLNFKYKRSLFNDQSIARHLVYFNNLLAAITANAEQAIHSYDLLPPEEKRYLLTAFNAMPQEIPKHRCIHELFAEQAAKTPDNLAVIFEDQHLSYRQLHEKSNQLALYLQQQGVTPDSLVALCINRSLDMLVALLGILKAGGAYLPIDATLPAERIKSLLQESGARLLISQQILVAELSAMVQGIDCQLIPLDTNWAVIAQTTGRLVTTVTPSHLAYVIYTSGSTGQPKGVMVEHRNVVNHNLAVIDAYQLTAKDRVLQFSTISFDIFVEEVFPTLLAGAAVVLMDGKHYTDVQYLKTTLNQHHVSLINLPTAFWHTLVEEQFDANHLKRVVIGGEKAEREKFNAWQQNNPTITVINTYGPTETTVISLLYKINPRLPPEQQIPLGTPLANTQVYVLDPYLNLVPVGVQGELHIAGAGVARGYLHQPELTAKQFINNPFGTGQLYKTGDLVRWLTDGNLDYIGRADDQIKIRGFRVELGEIERILIKHEQVINAVVIAQKHARGTQLIAYYQAENMLDEADLRSYLRKLLPDYMLPSALQRLDEIPMTSNGKINRQLLQSKTIEIESNTPYVAPGNAIETALTEIWQEVLGIPQIGIHDNFFALGGHSLLAIQIILRTNKKLAVNISLSTLFDAADIQQLAVIVAQSEQSIVNDTLAQFAENSDELIF